MCSPAMALILVFSIAPLGLAIVSAFLHFDIRMRMTWAGPANFAFLLTPVALKAFGMSLLFGLANIILTTGTSLIGGLALSQFPGRWWVLFKIGAMFVGTSTSILWIYLFHPIMGGMNQILALFEVGPVLWHSQAWAARAAVILVIWAWSYPDAMYTIAMAARAVPLELLEAARIEGASAWREFWLVVVPMIRRPLTLIMVNRISVLFLVYEAPTMLWGGGPLGATATALMRMVEWTGKPGEYGHSAAMALAVLVATVPLSWVAWRIGNREV